MRKIEFVKKVAESLGLSKRQAEYYISFILDLAILEAERTGKLKIDSHIFYKRTISERTWTGALNGIEYNTPSINLVSYRNTKKFKNPNRRKSLDSEKN